MSIPGLYYTRRPTLGTWTAKGRTDLADDGGRASLVPGAYRPDSTTAGVLPGVTRSTYTPPTGTWTITTAGTLVENLTVNGNIRVMAANVTIRNCEVRGTTSPASTMGCVVLDTGSTGALVEDSTLGPATLAGGGPWTYGLRGAVNGATIRRVDIRHCVDGAMVWGANDVTFEGVYIHDLYASPSAPDHADGTHSDGIQCEGGGIRLDINGCDINVSAAWAFGPGSLSCLMMTANRGAIGWVKLRNSWTTGGSIPVNKNNVAPTTAPYLSITDNVMAQGQQSYSGTYYHAIIDSATQAIDTISGNVDADTGGAIRVANGG